MNRWIIVCLILCLIAPVTINAKKKHLGKKLYWEISDGVLTISGKGEMPDNCYLIWKDESSFEKVIIEDGVTSVGDWAFFTCYSLQSAIIPNTVTSIGRYAFWGCKDFRSLTIPNSVTSIGEKAFALCINLEVTIPNSVISIGEESFYMCYELKGNIPNSVTSIGKKAFVFCSNLRSVEIPGSVSAIGDSTFYYCMGLQSVVIPNSVQKIGKGVFSDCFCLHSIKFPNHIMNDLDINQWREWGLPDKRFDEYMLFNELKTGREITKCFDGYIVKDGESKGIVNKNGQWILASNTIWNRFSDFKLLNEEYVEVKDSNGYGIYTKEGQLVIPTERDYTSISDFNTTNRTFAFTKKGYIGVCNERGEEISLTKLPPTADDIKEKGGYARAVEINNGNTKYWKVSKNGRYGLTDEEGKVIVPTEMEALESAGTGYLRYKLNGFWGLMNYAGKIIIDTDRGYTSIGDFKTFNKRFPYTMNGYKGECDINGRQISKIKVETPLPSKETKTTVVAPEKGELFPYYSYVPIKNGQLDLANYSKSTIDGVAFDFSSTGKIVVKMMNKGNAIESMTIYPQDATLHIDSNVIKITFTENGISKAISIMKTVSGTDAKKCIMWTDDNSSSSGKLFGKMGGGEVSKLGVLLDFVSQYMGSDFDGQFNRIMAEFNNYSWKRKN